MTHSQQIAASLRVERRDGAWWVVSAGELVDPSGAYKTQREALEAKRGLQRYWRNHHKKGFVRHDR